VDLTAALQEIDSRDHVIETRDHEIAVLSSDNRLLRQELASIRQGIFGSKTERLLPGQLALFGQKSVLPALPDKEPQEVKEKSKSKGHGRQTFSAALPREEQNFNLPEEERICSCCNEVMRKIKEQVTERGEIIPKRVIVHRYIASVYACPNGHEVCTAPVPEPVVPRAKYEASVYAHLVVSKYGDHIPLNRLEGIFKRNGLHLPKQTMWDMLCAVDDLVAQPIIEQMRLEILESDVLHSDDTTIKVKVEGQKGSKQGHIWTWRTPRPLTPNDEPCKTFVEFTLGRNRTGPQEFLGNWDGTLIIDGLAVYNEVIAVNGIKRAGCWAHARRGFVKALKSGTKAAALMLAPMHRLFWIERAILKRAKERNLSKEDIFALRKRVRDKRSREVQLLIFERAFDLQDQPTTMPESQLGKALGYLVRQSESLQLCVDEPRIPIHNNDAERDLRHVAIGRNNYHAFSSEKGGAVAARLYTLILSAKHAGINPEAYIRDLLTAISTTPASEIWRLTPWAWAKSHPESKI
jgi:transposase